MWGVGNQKLLGGTPAECGSAVMVSLLRKAARMSLVAMDFVLQVTVEDLVLGRIDGARFLTFELSRGTKVSGLPPKNVAESRSEWGQTMQMRLTLFLDRRSGRFQDKEYKLRLVQKDECGKIMLPVLATFTLDASLYAHLGAGPSQDQQVDLYAPKLNGMDSCATVRLRVRCSEPRERPKDAYCSSPSDVNKEATFMIAPPVSGSGLPRRGSFVNGRKPSLPPLRSGLLVGSSFGFSVSDSDSRHSPESSRSSSFSVSGMQIAARPWNADEPDATVSIVSVRSKLGSKSFTDLDGSEHYTPLADSGVIAPGLRSSISFHGILGSIGDNAGGESSAHSLVERTSERMATGILTSSPSTSITERGGSMVGRSPAGIALRYDRTTTLGYNRLLARFTKGPSPRAIKPIEGREEPEGQAGDAPHMSPFVPAGAVPSDEARCTRASLFSERGHEDHGDRRVGGIARRGDREREHDGARSGKQQTLIKVFATNSGDPDSNEDKDKTDDRGEGEVRGNCGDEGTSVSIARQSSSGNVNGTTSDSGNCNAPLKPRGSPAKEVYLGTRLMMAVEASNHESSEGNVSCPRGDGEDEKSAAQPWVAGIPMMVVSPASYRKSEPRLDSVRRFPLPSTPASLFKGSSLQLGGRSIARHVSIGMGRGRGMRFANRPSLSISSTSNSEGGWRTSTPQSSSNTSCAGTAMPSSSAMVAVAPVNHTSETIAAIAVTTPRRGIVLAGEHSSARGCLGNADSLLRETSSVATRVKQNQRQLFAQEMHQSSFYQSRFASAPGFSSSLGNVIHVRDCGRSDSSVGGGSAAEAPPTSSSSVPVVLSEGGTISVRSGESAGGGSRREINLECLREREKRIAHLESALVRSEIELCRAKTELVAARQEVYEMKKSQEEQDRLRPIPADVSALYHALEGSVVLLQIASEKMLRLERCLHKHSTVVPEPVFTELQKCVTQDTFATSPLPTSPLPTSPLPTSPLPTSPLPTSPLPATLG